MSIEEEALGDFGQHLEKTPEGHTRWVTSRELHARGLISDEEYARRKAALDQLAKETFGEGHGGEVPE